MTMLVYLSARVLFDYLSYISI